MTVAASLPAKLSINPDLDIDALSKRYAVNGRIQIADFLSPASAKTLYDDLNSRTDWRHVINGEKQIFEIPSQQFDNLAPAERAAIDGAMHSAAEYGFQFQFDTVRVPDEKRLRAQSHRPIDHFAQFMGSPAIIGMLRKISGVKDIIYADAQATRYRSGDFLTRHDDAVAGKNRRLAYVLGLTPEWRAEWGGLLHFHGGEEHIVETMVPRYNALTLFSVGQQHSVSHIAPFARHARHSMTGWLRASEQPD